MQDPLHRFAGSNQIFHVFEGRYLRPQGFILLFQGDLLGCITDEVGKVVGIERFGDIVVGSVFERFHRGIDRGKGSHHNDDRIGFMHFDATQHFQPVHARHFNIGQYDVERPGFEHVQCRFGILG